MYYIYCNLETKQATIAKFECESCGTFLGTLTGERLPDNPAFLVQTLLNKHNIHIVGLTIDVIKVKPEPTEG